MKPYKLYAIVQPGLEDYAEQELRNFGIKNFKKEKGGFEFHGHLTTLFRLNTYCRTITRILVRFAEFKAVTFGELEKKLHKIEWNLFLKNQKVAFRAHSFRSKLYHESAIVQRVSKVINEKLQTKFQFVSSIEDSETQLILIHAQSDNFTISIDSSGMHLHKRGCMQLRTKAPLRETVAAAMIFASGWQNETPLLIDPMCGSGTIPLEAFNIINKIPAWKYRSFAFEKWSNFDENLWNQFKEKTSIQNETENGKIFGFDIDKNAIDVAKGNLKLADLSAQIKFEQKDFLENNTIYEKQCVIITNPPYGKRLSGEKKKDIYKKLIDLKKKNPQNDVIFLIPKNMLNMLKIKYDILFEFKNGDILVCCVKLLK